MNLRARPFPSLASVIPAALTGLLLASAAAAAPPVERLEDLLQRVRQRQAGIQSLRAEFVEERSGPLLAEPVTVRGRFEFLAPDRLRWESAAPDPMVLVIAGQELTAWYVDLGRAQRVRLGRQGRLLSRYFAAGATLDELLEYFDVDWRAPASPGEAHRLRLVPRYPRIARRLAELTLWIDPDTDLPVRFSFRDGGGAVTDLRFLELEVDPALPADRFVLELPSDVMVEEAEQTDAIALP